MRSQSWKALLVLASLGWLPGPVAAVKFVPPVERALEIVAQRTGIPSSELSVTASASADYPLSAVRASAFKIADSSGETYEVMVGELGEELDGETLESREEALYAETYGTLDKDLYEHLSRSSLDEPVSVAIWLGVPDDEGLARPDPGPAESSVGRTEGEFEALLASADRARTAIVDSVVEPLVAALRAAGFEAEANPYSPVVHATLPAGVVAIWGRAAEVDRVSLERTLEPNLAISRPSVGATNLQAIGVTGAGVRLAQIEVGGRVELGNPFLPGVTQDAANVCAAASDHSTAVAGIIVSTHPTERGIAFGSQLRAYGSCLGQDNELRRGASAAADWGARALNMSFGRDDGGRLGAQDRFYDDMVQNRWRTVVVSAGNNSGGFGSGTGNVGSPGTAYNVVTVGASFHAFTPDPVDDAMAVFSSWRDPISTYGDREKPEVAAPGQQIATTGVSFPWLNPSFSGTSAAAPIVTGSTGLLFQTNPSLSVWPETIKALLMASAVHNVEGDPRLSEIDGAGGIAVDVAAQVARGQLGGFGGRSYTCFTSKNLDVATMNLTAGVPVRVVIAWDQNPNFKFYESRPSADLDLRVIDPGGVIVARSASFDNTYEIVQFTPTRSGPHRLRVFKYRCSLIIRGSNPRWLGWAWYQQPAPPVRRGMTWAKVDHNFAFGTDRFNCSGCNAYQGETFCSEAHQVLCHRPDGSPNPGLPINGNDGWVGGNVGLSPTIRGDQLLSLANANAVCSNFFGPGWTMAEFHHPLGGWGWSSRGNVQAPVGSRFWVYINDQQANCWN